MCKICTLQLIFSFDTSAEGVEAGLDVFVTAVDLVYMVNAGRAFGRHGGNQHGNTRTDVGGSHVVTLQLALMVMPHDYRPMRVAKDNLRTHVNQFVHEEKAGFKHLLMYQYGALCLRRHHQKDR